LADNNKLLYIAGRPEFLSYNHRQELIQVLYNYWNGAALWSTLDCYVHLHSIVCYVFIYFFCMFVCHINKDYTYLITYIKRE